MRHYHVTIWHAGRHAVHSVGTLSAVLRIIRQYTGWADHIDRATCYKRACHPLAVN